MHSGRDPQALSPERQELLRDPWAAADGLLPIRPNSARRAWITRQAVVVCGKDAI
jgi:hypothetical protein